MKSVTMSVTVALLLGGCSSRSVTERPAASTPLLSPPPAAQPVSSNASVSRQLMHDVQSAPQLYDIRANRGDGLGRYALNVEGKAIWPPHGARCEELVRCCKELATLADSLALACLLATARDQNCRLARKTTSEIALEQGHDVPASCVR